jgi:DNA ligase-1
VPISPSIEEAFCWQAAALSFFYFSPILRRRRTESGEGLVRGIRKDTMLLKDLVDASKKVSATTRRKEKTFLLGESLKRARGLEIALAASYLSGQIPQGRLGIGWAVLQKAMENPVERPRPLSLLEVNRYFEEIARAKGAGAVEKKVRALRGLFSSAREEEKEFLVGLILSEVRQGALEGLVLEAVAQASGLPLERIQQGGMFSGNIGEVARAALEEGLQGLSRFRPRLFRPIAPMLANAAEAEEDALARWGRVACEFKVDGARIQIHKEGEEIRVFTRHLKEVTARVPEIVTVAREFLLDKAIFEGETFAVRPDGRALPFQTTMRRFGRIQEIERTRKDIPLTSYFFDLLYLEGKTLFDEHYQKRFELLSERVPSAYRIPQIVTADEKEIHEFLQESLKAGHEGIMAKGVDSPYVAGQRGSYWLKIKPAKTLDLVVLAAEWGHGRRKGWLSNLHLGAPDPESGQFVMLGKTFKGLTDEMLRWQTERLLSLETRRDEWTVYVQPKLVVEIAYSDLQESPRYPGGLALRFARVKSYREEKSPSEADTIQGIQAIFEASRG